MLNPFKKPNPYAEAAEQNQEAASSNPLDVAAETQSGELSGELQSASVVEGSAIHGTTEDSLSQDEANKYMEEAIYNDVNNAGADDTFPEQQLAAAIKGFIRAGQARYEGKLEQATTQAEILRCLGDALIHLNDHVAQRVATEATNG